MKAISISLAPLLFIGSSFAQQPDPIAIDYYSSVDLSDCSDNSHFFEGVFDALYLNAADSSAQLQNRLESIRKIRDMAFVPHECVSGSDWTSSTWVYGWYAIQKLGDLIVVSRSMSDAANRDTIQLQAAQALLDIASNYRVKHFGWYNTQFLPILGVNYYARPVEAIDAIVQSFCIHSMALKNNTWSVQWGKPVVSDAVLNPVIERLRTGIIKEESIPELRDFTSRAADLLTNLRSLKEPVELKQVDHYMGRYFYPEGSSFPAPLSYELFEQK